MTKLLLLLIVSIAFSTPVAAHLQYGVASNFGREDRPMKSNTTNENIGRVMVGTVCGEFVRSTLFGRYKYYAVTNAEGLEGHVICREIEHEHFPAYLQRVPGLIEFEDFVSAVDSDRQNRGGIYRDDFGVDIENKTGDGSGANIGWTGAGESLTYDIDVGSLGYYLIRVRYAREDHENPINIDVFVDGIKVLNVGEELKPTGGWDVWNIYRIGGILLAEGRHEIRIDIISGHVNLDWFDMVDDNGLITITVMAIS